MGPAPCCDLRSARWTSLNWHDLFLFLPVGYILKLFCVFLQVGYILKLFCVFLQVGYCEVMFLCMYGFCLYRSYPRAHF